MHVLNSTCDVMSAMALSWWRHGRGFSAGFRREAVGGFNLFRQQGRLLYVGQRIG
jgi:hypothetical protein